MKEKKDINILVGANIKREREKQDILRSVSLK